MLRRSKSAMSLWILALALVAIRMTGIHVHLCTDGQEAPVAVHLPDGATHHFEHHGDADHQDQDLGASDSTVIKKANPGIDILPVLGALVLLFLLPFVRPRFAFATTPAIALGRERHRSPPLRAPPLQASPSHS